MRDLDRALVDASLDAACIVDSDLRIHHLNANYVRLSGLRFRDLRSSERKGLCHNHFMLESCADGKCVARRAFESKRHCRVDEVRSARFDLRLIVVAIPILDAHGDVLWVLEQYRDVTAESRMQTNYKRLLEFERHQNEALSAEVERKTEKLEAANRELELALSQVRELARTDALTQLVNRRHFEEVFRQELTEAQWRSHSLCLVVFDLDFFKRINDEHGHAAGDSVLRRFAEVLRSNTRTTDLVSRIGGEEFTVLLPGADAMAGLALYQRVRAALKESFFPTTASAGLATYPADGETEDALFEQADRALYAAKAQGRDRILVSRRDGERSLGRHLPHPEADSLRLDVAV